MHVIHCFLLMLKPWGHGWRGVCRITITVILQLKNEAWVQFQFRLLWPLG